ncbi:hypothetical protein HZH68_005975 [Vespula germanica]|uniref:Uncharacterized protein n=1 Tax=Vespula germanica TaxID=30212 RepID=A0A834KCF5_VESGE|nr:hypothetical protein HZH68_005975 [Vespula germanica]
MFRIDIPVIKYNPEKNKREYVPKIQGYRRGLHSDLPALEHLISDWYAIRLAQWRKEQGLGGNLGLH